MKKIILLTCFFLFINGYASLKAQNKTFSIGATKLNPNAVLQVESPTGNQGFIMPRLTTAQRTATGFVSILGAADNGLMVYDADLRTIFIWNGFSWQTTGEVAGGVSGILNSPDPESFAILGQNNGGGPAGFFKVSSTTNTTNALGVTNAGTGNALFAEMTGTGTAGSFRNNSATSTSPVIIATQSGTGPALQLNQINNGMAIEMTSGGLKYSVATISTPGNITVLSAVYKITIAGTFSLPTGVPEGTFCKVFNSSTEMITVGEGSIFSNEARDYIFINGQWY